MTHHAHPAPLRLCAHCGRRSTVTLTMKTSRRRRYYLCGSCFCGLDTAKLFSVIAEFSESIRRVSDAIVQAFGVPAKLF
jgi:transcription elongation factor Elf1